MSENWDDNVFLSKQSLVKLEGWEDIVTIISCDMRHWDAPEKADILVCKYFNIVFSPLAMCVY